MTRWLMLLGQVLLWGLAIYYLLRVRVRVDESAILVTEGRDGPGDGTGDGTGDAASSGISSAVDPQSASTAESTATTARHDAIIAALIEGEK
jgi:hypothetical protein